MTLCPLCNEGLKSHRTPGVQHFSCGTLVRQAGVAQADKCRVRQLERVLLEILPLAKQVSCRHDWDQVSAMNECCDWAGAVESIEALSIQPKETADAVKR